MDNDFRILVNTTPIPNFTALYIGMPLFSHENKSLIRNKKNDDNINKSEALKR